MRTTQVPHSRRSSSVEDAPSTIAPEPDQPRTTPAPIRADNPTFRGLTVRRPSLPAPGVTNIHVEREDNVGRTGRSAKAALGEIPLPLAGGAATTSAAHAGTAPTHSFDDLPDELIQEMNLDPHQMQFVSRRYAGIFHGEAAASSLAGTPARANTLRAVGEAVNQLERVVPQHLRHDPLAVLCERLDAVPPQERLQSFDLLFDATQKCTSSFKPLAELYVQTNEWGSPMRETCQARLATLEGAHAAQVVTRASEVIDRQGIPPLLERMDGLTDIQKSVVLGTLAKRLLSLHHLASHDFARICEDFHQQPWPPVAASGLLSRIGWITDAARQSLTARSQG